MEETSTRGMSTMAKVGLGLGMAGVLGGGLALALRAPRLGPGFHRVRVGARVFLESGLGWTEVYSSWRGLEAEGTDTVWMRETPAPENAVFLHLQERSPLLCAAVLLRPGIVKVQSGNTGAEWMLAASLIDMAETEAYARFAFLPLQEHKQSGGYGRKG